MQRLFQVNEEDQAEADRVLDNYLKKKNEGHHVSSPCGLCKGIL